MATSDSPANAQPTCTACGTALTAPFRFCSGCGNDSSDRCDTCGRILPTDEMVCNNCSTPRRAPGPDTPMGNNTWDVLLTRLREGLKGEFRVTRELGRGGQAAVYLAEELALKRQVAIKVLARNASYLDDNVVARFQAEARTIAGFRHPNIVTIYSIRKLGALPYFIMQYLEGHSLAAMLDEKKVLAWSLARVVLYQVGSALEYAHGRGVVHRDVKPANIIFDEDGNAVVTDFGIAKKLKEGATNSTSSLLGTPAYMSPEQCNGESVTPASDQYALGIVAYQLVAGRVPFEGSDLTVLHGHTKGEVPPLSQFVRDCPPHIESAIRRMLSKRATDRFATLHSALDALGATEVEDNDPRKVALQKLAMNAREQSGRLLTPTYGFAAMGGSRFVLRVPEQLAVGATAQCDVLLEHTGEVSKSVTSKKEHAGPVYASTVSLPVTWSVSPATAAHIDHATGVLTARHIGALTIRAIVNGQSLSSECRIVAATRAAPSKSSGAVAAVAPAATYVASRTAPHPVPHRAAARMLNARNATIAVGVLALLVAGGAYAFREDTSTLPVANVVAPVPEPALPPQLPDSGTELAPIGDVRITGMGSLITAGETHRLQVDPEVANVRWSSLRGRVSIDAASGRLTAQSSGSDSIFAEVGGRRVAARWVRVTSVTGMSLSYIPPLQVGESNQLAIQATGVAGRSFDSTATFRCDVQDVVSIDPIPVAGKYTVRAIGQGRVVITITVDGYRKAMDPLEVGSSSGAMHLKEDGF